VSVIISTFYNKVLSVAVLLITDIMPAYLRCFTWSSVSYWI